MKYVFLELSGGLGNQVFLYETAKHIASVDGRTIILNKFHIDKKHSQGRSTIENFITAENVKYAKRIIIISKILIYTKKYLKYLNKFKQNIIFILGENENEFHKDSLRELILQRRPKIIFIYGFRQDFELWPEKVEYSLMNKSKTYSELSEKSFDLNPIIVHYRLGRINNNWEHSWGALSPQFILNSLNLFKSVSNIENQKIWIFSNDLSHAKELFLKFNSFENYDIDFIDDYSMSAAEVMKLFSKSRFLICSNSTFSLVAAKIGNVPNVIVPAELSKNYGVIIPFPTNWIPVESVWL
jgi:hypothetical protein